MNFLMKCAHLYDKMDEQPGIETSSGAMMGVAFARRSDLRNAGKL
jgi:hypothetical protein